MGRVIVVGSLHYDIMVRAPGRPRRGETLMGDAWFPKCGGKGGNQAVEAALAGASVLMVGAVGADGFAAPLVDHLQRSGVDTRHVATVSGQGSGMSVAILEADGDYGAVVVSGANRAICLPDDLLLAADDVVVLQNEIPETVNLAAARRARQAGAQVVLNAAPARPWAEGLAPEVDILVVNAVEAEMLGGGVVADRDSALAAARRLAGVGRTAVVTAGGAGLAFAGPAGEGRREPLAVTVASTHGAGDCLVGVLAAGLAAGQPFAAAITAANAAAGRLVAMTEEERPSRRPPNG